MRGYKHTRTRVPWCIYNNDETVTVTGTTAGAETVGDASAVAVTPAEGGTFTYTSGVLAAGEYTVSVVAVKGEETSEAKTATVTVANVAPTVVSVENINGNQLVVTFSEKIGAANAIDLTNYKLQNTVTAKALLLNGSGSAVLNADGKSVTVTLGATEIDPSGGGVGIEGLNTLDAVNYRLFVNPGTAVAGNIFDLSGNRVAVNSYKEFAGVIASDTAAPVLQTATLDLEIGTLALAFNEITGTSIDTVIGMIMDVRQSIFFKLFCKPSGHFLHPPKYSL